MCVSRRVNTAGCCMCISRLKFRFLAGGIVWGTSARSSDSIAPSCSFLAEGFEAVLGVYLHMCVKSVPCRFGATCCRFTEGGAAACAFSHVETSPPTAANYPPRAAAPMSSTNNGYSASAMEVTMLCHKAHLCYDEAAFGIPVLPLKAASCCATFEGRKEGHENTLGQLFHTTYEHGIANVGALDQLRRIVCGLDLALRSHIQRHSRRSSALHFPMRCRVWRQIVMHKTA